MNRKIVAALLIWGFLWVGQNSLDWESHGCKTNRWVLALTKGAPNWDEYCVEGSK